MKKIFVDMDGVLSDFEGRYRDLFNTEPGEKRDDKFSERWRILVDEEHFASFDLFSGAAKLIDYLDSKVSIQKAILSSTGGFIDHDAISDQKREWLWAFGIEYPAIFVPGKQYKPGYADADSLLIDDTLSIIKNFQNAGGHAIHHTNVDETISFIEGWLND
jgi:hypothetical protein